MYIDRRSNNKYMPGWLLSTFNTYKVNSKINEEPCDLKKSQKKEYQVHQKFIHQFMTSKGNVQNIMLYHEPGSGKTLTAIGLFSALRNVDKHTHIFVLTKASLVDTPWKSTIESWLGTGYASSVNFITYDSNNAAYKFNTELTKVDVNNHPVICVIEESHLFINMVYNNMKTHTSVKGNALQLYEKLQYLTKVNKASRIISLTGTPAVNTPYELVVHMNLLSNNLFPMNEDEFKYTFMENNKLALAMKYTFQKRIYGLVSHYTVTENNPNAYAKRIDHVLVHRVDDWYKDAYIMYDSLEKRSSSMNSSQGYRSLTRHMCNFMFPDSKNRPLASNYSNEAAYHDALDRHIVKFRKYMSTLPTDKVHDILKQSSPKMYDICTKISDANQPALVFSSFINGEGLEILSIYMDIFKIPHHTISGEIKREERTKLIKDFDTCSLGDKPLTMLISMAMAEGIEFNNVRQIHILEPSWNESKTDQAIMRGIRYCSHNMLPKEQRVVDIYKHHISISDTYMTTDQHIYNLSQEKMISLTSFFTAIKESAIDCELFQPKAKCFHLFDDYLLNSKSTNIYEPNIILDIKQAPAIEKLITVYEIKVKYHSDVINAWLNRDTHHVYHYNTNHLLGKLALDNYGDYVQCDKHVFVLDEIIDYNRFIV